MSSILQSTHGSIYNPENVFVASDGGGAGNNWAYGYAQAQKLEDPILDMIEREAEGADNFEVSIPEHQVTIQRVSRLTTLTQFRALCSVTLLLEALAPVSVHCYWRGYKIVFPKS